MWAPVPGPSFARLHSMASLQLTISLSLPPHSFPPSLFLPLPLMRSEVGDLPELSIQDGGRNDEDGGIGGAEGVGAVQGGEPPGGPWRGGRGRGMNGKP
jgi:hypothetical protein